MKLRGRKTGGMDWHGDAHLLGTLYQNVSILDFVGAKDDGGDDDDGSY